MKSTSRIVNPYLPRKKEPSKDAKEGPASTKALAPKGHAAVDRKPIGTTKSVQVQMMKPKASLLPQQVDPKQKVTRNQFSLPKGDMDSKGSSGAVSLASSRNPKTLKQKLKQEIENLKRAKALKKQKAIEEKRRKEQELLRRKAEDEAQKHKRQQQTANIPATDNVSSPNVSVLNTSSPLVGPQKAAVVSVEKSHPTLTFETSLVVATPRVDSRTIPHVTKTTETTTDEHCRPDKVGGSAENSTQPSQVFVKLEGAGNDFTTQQDPFSLSTSTENQMFQNNTSTVLSDRAESSLQVFANQTTDASWQSSIIKTKQTLVDSCSGKGKSASSIENAEYSRESISIDMKNRQALPCSTAFAKNGPAPLPSYNPNSPIQPLAPHHGYPSPYPAQSFYPGVYDQARGTNPMAEAVNPMAGSNRYNPWLFYLAMGQNGVSPVASVYGDSMFQPICYTPCPHPPQTGLPPVVSGAYQQHPRPPQSAKQVQPKILAGDLLDYPSPYASTYVLLDEPILLLKETDTSSYGVVVEVRSESALVEPEWFDRQSISVMPNPEKDKTKICKPDKDMVDHTRMKAPRRRRRRHVFSSMMVLNPDKQNNLEVQRANTLQKGDIILQIGDHYTAGCTFAEACKLFHSATKTIVNEKYSSGVYVIVARLRPQQKPNTVVPTIELPNSVRPVTVVDVRRWAFLRLNSFFKNDRLLGINLTSDDIQQLSAIMKETPLEELENSWQKYAQEARKTMISKATLYWKSEWSKEPPAIREAAQRTYLSDAQRSRMRAAARPRNGCKCGSKSHVFVNDLTCPLYSNLFRFGLEPGSTTSDNPTKSQKIKFQDRKLKAVEAAFTGRIAREKLEKDNEEAEAVFVNRAEAVQLRQLRQAIFAPSLTVMVISTLAALKPIFEKVKEHKSWSCKSVSKQYQNTIVSGDKTDLKVGTSRKAETGADTREGDIEDDDDDDVLLVNLGKRNLPAAPSSHSKKAKSESTNIDLECLARILLYMSERWGHVYREPSNVDYAWRWELFHGQIGTSNWNTSAKNPRSSLSLENIRFALDENVISLLRHGEAKTPAQMEAVTLLSVVLDPSSSGIIDEILALRQSSVVRTDTFGIPRLSGSWHKYVDLLVLEEMAISWSFEMDPVGKYGVHDSVRNLATKWIRHEEGWALTSDPEDIIYDLEEFTLWREAFGTKHEEQVEQLQGVGKYGI